MKPFKTIDSLVQVKDISPMERDTIGEGLEEYFSTMLGANRSRYTRPNSTLQKLPAKHTLRAFYDDTPSD